MPPPPESSTLTDAPEPGGQVPQSADALAQGLAPQAESIAPVNDDGAKIQALHVTPAQMMEFFQALPEVLVRSKRARKDDEGEDSAPQKKCAATDGEAVPSCKPEEASSSGIKHEVDNEDEEDEEEFEDPELEVGLPDDLDDLTRRRRKAARKWMTRTTCRDCYRTIWEDDYFEYKSGQCEDCERASFGFPPLDEMGGELEVEGEWGESDEDE
ncbi:hypothetical protein EWM64_g1843 [Hericium alpestre]|uniref:Uncharacterized protein n=1 Tax=Hericium alpestre TaxID=135208 RepID=A0A4Z0A8A9_9AGAM|nr:hypothetical protein EWM64_g1843 [Hericium alpestre]